MKCRYPLGWYVYSILIAISSLCTLFGFHRTWYLFLQTLSLPDLLIGGLTGILNLSWYEIGYEVGGGLKNVHIFIAIPLLGGVTGLLSAVLLCLHISWSRRIAFLHIIFSIGLSALSLGVLGWRFMRGSEDAWRLAATFSFILMYCLWFLILRKAQRPSETSS
jgi:hypothetical protein